MPGINNCPLSSVGIIDFHFWPKVQSHGFTDQGKGAAEIRAWLAMMAAAVAITIPDNYKPFRHNAIKRIKAQLRSYLLSNDLAYCNCVSNQHPGPGNLIIRQVFTKIHEIRIFPFRNAPDHYTMLRHP